MTTPEEMSEAMHQVMDLTKQMEEAARGLREHMEREGWSPTAAEAAALTWLQGAITGAMS